MDYIHKDQVAGIGLKEKLTNNQGINYQLTEEDEAKVWLRTLLSNTNSQNIEANVDFLYSLITGEEL